MKWVNVAYIRASRMALCWVWAAFTIIQPAWSEAPKLEDAPIASHYIRDTYYDAKKGHTYTTSKIRKTILSPEGIDHASQLSFTYSQNDRVRVIDAAIVQPNGKRIKLRKKQIDTRLVASSSNGFTQDKKLSFLFPKLEVGATVELVFEHFHSGDTDPGKVGRLLRYMPNKERVDSLFEEYTSDQPWFVKHIHTDNYEISLSDDQKKLTVRQKNPESFYFINEPSIAYVRKIPTIALHTTEDVQARVDREMRAWNQNLKAPLPAPMKAAVDQLSHHSPEEKVIGLLRYIRDNYRYLGDWRGVRRGWLPFPLAEIAQRGYGDCKDLSLALVAMLRASGIEAEPAVVERGLDSIPLLLPSVTSYNHAIVRAQIGEKIWWLDPTNPAFLPDYIMPDLHARLVWVFEQNNHVRCETIPKESRQSVERHKTIHHDRKGNQKIYVKTFFDGFPAIVSATQDYYHGFDQWNRQLCGKEKNCKVKREKIDFVVPDTYSININYDSKAQMINPNTVWVSAAPLASLAQELKHYIDHEGKTDLSLANVFNTYERTVFKKCHLNQSIKPYRIESPWLDYELKWYNSPKEEGCVMEFRVVRKVDWLEHETIMSKDFQVFFEAFEAMSKELQQALTLSDTADATLLQDAE